MEERSYRGQAQVATDNDFEAIFESFIVRENEVAIRLEAKDHHDGAKWYVDALVPRHSDSHQSGAVEMVFPESKETCPATIRFLELAPSAESCYFVIQFIQDGNPEWTYALTATLLPFNASSNEA
jgi:hypothetical protein